jgi:hypothetical protein
LNSQEQASPSSSKLSQGVHVLPSRASNNLY